MPEHKSLADALLAFQSKVPVLQKDAVNPHFRNRYVSLDAITQTITPILHECGLVWITMPVIEHDAPALAYKLLHLGTGQAVEGVMPLLLSKGDMQGLGSALSYARRYAVSAVLGLSAEDDDGQQATRPAARVASTPQPAPVPVLTDEQRGKVLAAINAAGREVPLVLAAIGVDSTDDLTTQDARKIKALLEKAA